MQVLDDLRRARDELMVQAVANASMKGCLLAMKEQGQKIPAEVLKETPPS